MENKETIKYVGYGFLILLIILIIVYLILIAIGKDPFKKKSGTTSTSTSNTTTTSTTSTTTSTSTTSTTTINPNRSNTFSNNNQASMFNVNGINLATNLLKAFRFNNLYPEDNIYIGSGFIIDIKAKSLLNPPPRTTNSDCSLTVYVGDAYDDNYLPGNTIESQNWRIKATKGAICNDYIYEGANKNKKLKLCCDGDTSTNIGSMGLYQINSGFTLYDNSGLPDELNFYNQQATEPSQDEENPNKYSFCVDSATQDTVDSSNFSFLYPSSLYNCYLFGVVLEKLKIYYQNSTDIISSENIFDDNAIAHDFSSGDELERKTMYPRNYEYDIVRGGLVLFGNGRTTGLYPGFMGFFRIHARCDAAIQGEYLELWTGMQWITLCPPLSTEEQLLTLPNPACFGVPITPSGDIGQAYKKDGQLQLNTQMIRIRLKRPEKFFKTKGGATSNLIGLPENLLYNNRYGPNGVSFTIHTPELYNVQNSRPLWGKIFLTDVGQFPKCLDNYDSSEASLCDYSNTNEFQYYNPPSTLDQDQAPNYEYIRAVFVPYPGQWTQGQLPSWINANQPYKCFQRMATKTIQLRGIIPDEVFGPTNNVNDVLQLQQVNYNFPSVIPIRINKVDADCIKTYTQRELNSGSCLNIPSSGYNDDEICMIWEGNHPSTNQICDNKLLYGNWEYNPLIWNQKPNSICGYYTLPMVNFGSVETSFPTC